MYVNGRGALCPEIQWLGVRMDAHGRRLKDAGQQSPERLAL